MLLSREKTALLILDMKGNVLINYWQMAER